MPRKKSGTKPGRETNKSRAPSARGAKASKKIAPSERRSIEGWETLDRKKRSHINRETGEILSDRQYRQRFLYGGSKLEKVAKTRGAPRAAYNRLLRARQDYLEHHGIKANLREIRSSDAMKQIIKDLNKHKAALRKGKKLSEADRLRLFGPDSDLAKALADLGYRDPDARHWVGDS